jgi:hypothetical protein
MTFGIPINAIPLNFRGVLDVATHLHHLQQKRLLEQQADFEEQMTTPNGTVMYPDNYDVLLGRGRPFQNFPGNANLVELVEDRRQEYEGSNRLHKTNLTKEIMQVIQTAGGRFLKRHDDSAGQGWLEVSQEAAREKVSHSCRTKRGSGAGENTTTIPEGYCYDTQQQHQEQQYHQQQEEEEYTYELYS